MGFVSIVKLPMRSLRMIIAYDGTLFGGWQRQPQQRTVQAELERILEKITGEKSAIVASGRTDAGVHALSQVVGFRSHTQLSEADLKRAFNAELPEDIFVFEVSPAPHDFHPIRDAVRKRYRYLIQDDRVPNLFNRAYCWRVFQKLNVEAMAESAESLIGEHDFKAYQTGGSSRLTTIRTIYDIVVERRPCEYTDRVEIEIEADGFLYNMVRNIVGTLTRVGRGTQSTSWPGEVLASLDRKQAGMTAPAQGLYMQWVKYDV